MVHLAHAAGAFNAADYEVAVLAEVKVRLHKKINEMRASGLPLPAPAEVAESMASAIPSAPVRHPYADVLGPFYSSAGVIRMLGISKQALDDRRRRGTILAARTAEGVWVYPSFQFDLPNHRVRPSLTPVLSALHEAPRWGAALWLVTPHPELGGQSPLDAVEVGKAQSVVVLAQQYVAAVTAE